VKEKIIHSLSFVEDVIYVIVALLLTASAILLIYNEFISFPEFFKAENQVQTIIEIISKTLLLVMVLEILYTVRITIKEHVL